MAFSMAATLSMCVLSTVSLPFTTVNGAVNVTAPSFALIVVVPAATPVIRKVAVMLLGGTVTVGGVGTVATALLLLASATTIGSVGGAGALSVIVACVTPPMRIRDALSARLPVRVGSGSTVTVAAIDC